MFLANEKREEDGTESKIVEMLSGVVARRQGGRQDERREGPVIREEEKAALFPSSGAATL